MKDDDRGWLRTTCLIALNHMREALSLPAHELPGLQEIGAGKAVVLAGREDQIMKEEEVWTLEERMRRGTLTANKETEIAATKYEKAWNGHPPVMDLDRENLMIEARLKSLRFRRDCARAEFLQTKRGMRGCRPREGQAIKKA